MKNMSRIVTFLLSLAFTSQVTATNPILLIDFMTGATNPMSPDQNGNHWNTVGIGGSSGNTTANSTNLRLTDGTVLLGLNVVFQEVDGEFGTPASGSQWSGANPARQGQPDWVASDSISALDDRANLGNQRKATFTIEGLPELAPGEHFRIELVSAATGNFGTDAPGLWNLEAANSTGGNQENDQAGSIVPTNGLTGEPFVWTENSGTNANRFGFALFPNTSATETPSIPNQGWLVWDGVQPINNSFTIHASTHAGSAGNQRAPANALAVYVIPEPGTLMLLGISGLALLVFRRRK